MTVHIISRRRQSVIASVFSEPDTPAQPQMAPGKKEGNALANSETIN
jgi:hypothetical protein